MPIRWRLTLFIALAIGAILLVLGVALYFLLRDALLSNVEDTTRERADERRGEHTRRERPWTSDDVEELTLDGVFVIVRDESGACAHRDGRPSDGREARTPSGGGRSTRASLPRARPVLRRRPDLRLRRAGEPPGGARPGGRGRQVLRGSAGQHRGPRGDPGRRHRRGLRPLHRRRLPAGAGGPEAGGGRDEHRAGDGRGRPVETAARGEPEG